MIAYAEGSYPPSNDGKPNGRKAGQLFIVTARMHESIKLFALLWLRLTSGQITCHKIASKSDKVSVINKEVHKLCVHVLTGGEGPVTLSLFEKAIIMRGKCWLHKINLYHKKFIVPYVVTMHECQNAFA